MTTVSQQVTLPDGRRLGYDDYGPPDGTPLFYFHGTPSSRREWSLFGSQALGATPGMRAIVPDRPGLGLSDVQPRRRISDWPADLVALADRLGLARFAVLGYSGGAPYAAACAQRIPERLTAVGIASGVGPHDVPGLTDGTDPQVLQLRYLARDKPRLARLMIGLFLAAPARYAPHRLLAQTRVTLPQPDQAVLDRPEARAAFIAMLREAFRRGTRGVQADFALMASPWDFSPQDITVPVHLWQGEMDCNAPPAMGRYLAAAIPQCQAIFYPNDGHVSLIVNHEAEILRVLAVGRGAHDTDPAPQHGHSD